MKMVHVNSQKDDVLALNEISNVQRVNSLRHSLLDDPRNTFRFDKLEEKSFGILWGMSKSVNFESFDVISPTIMPHLIIILELSLEKSLIWVQTNGVARTLRKLRTSKGDYYIKQ